MLGICHIITGLGTGGAERALCRLIESGLASRFENHVISLTGDGPMAQPLREAGAHLHFAGERSKAGLPSEVIKRVRHIRPRILQGWMYHGNIAASAIRYLTPGAPPVLWNIRHSLSDLANEKASLKRIVRAGAWLSRWPETIIYNSDLARRQHEETGYAGSRAVVIPNGFIPYSASSCTAAPNHFWDGLGIAGGGPIALHVARLNPIKGHVDFIKAAVMAAGEVPGLQFVLVGNGVVSENEDLLGPIPESLRSRFHFLGERRDVERLMAAADMFVLSSHAEAFPNVLGEAMNTGTACISTDVGDAAKILAGHGILVPPRDIAAMSAAIVELARSPELRHQFGTAGASRIREKYSLDAVVAQYVALYENFA